MAARGCGLNQCAPDCGLKAAEPDSAHLQGDVEYRGELAWTNRALSFPSRCQCSGCTHETQKCRVLLVGPLYTRPHGQAKLVTEDTRGSGTAAAENPRKRGCRRGEADSHGLTYVPTSYWQACGWNSCSSRTHREERCCQQRQICFRPRNLRVVRSQGSTEMAIRADVDQ